MQRGLDCCSHRGGQPALRPGGLSWTSGCVLSLDTALPAVTGGGTRGHQYCVPAHRWVHGLLTLPAASVGPLAPWLCRGTLDRPPLTPSLVSSRANTSARRNPSVKPSGLGGAAGRTSWSQPAVAVPGPVTSGCLHLRGGTAVSHQLSFNICPMRPVGAAAPPSTCPSSKGSLKNRRQRSVCQPWQVLQPQ